MIFNEKPINDEHSVLTEKIETHSNCKVNDKIRISIYMNIFSKGYTKTQSREISVMDYALKTNPWTYKIKDLNGEK